MGTTVRYRALVAASCQAQHLAKSSAVPVPRRAACYCSSVSRACAHRARRPSLPDSTWRYRGSCSSPSTTSCCTCSTTPAGLSCRNGSLCARPALRVCLVRCKQPHSLRAPQPVRRDSDAGHRREVVSQHHHLPPAAE